MERVASSLNREIYFISTRLENQDYLFYINMPIEQRAFIVLNLPDNVNDINPRMVDIENLGGNISKVYDKFVGNDIAVVTPLIDSNSLEQLKISNNPQIYSNMNKFMGGLINTSYRCL